MTDYFVDTSVFLLAIGGDHPERSACREFLAQAAVKKDRLHASVEAAQEFVFHRMRRTDRSAALAQTRTLTGSVILHPFDDRVLEGTLELIESSALRGRDAVHVATAKVLGFTQIISLDSDFDGLDGIQRVSPSDA